MRITVTKQPEALVTLDLAKVALGESGNDRNTMIEGFLLSGQAHLDGPKGIVGITVAEQSVAVYFDDFDCDISLPGGTIIAPLTSVEYLDAAGELTALGAATYALQQSGRLALAAGASWPTVVDAGDAVVVRYDLGIKDARDPRIELMKTAILLHTRMMLDMTEPESYRRTIEAIVSPMRAIHV